MHVLFLDKALSITWKSGAHHISAWLKMHEISKQSAFPTFFTLINTSVLTAVTGQVYLYAQTLKFTSLNDLREV